MNVSALHGEWFALLMALLFSTVFALRVKFSDASKRAETAILLITTLLFFLLGGLLLHR